MNREIKFRVWHKRKKWLKYKNLILQNGKLFKDWRKFEDYEPLDKKQIEILYCTRLIDKNEIDIYEGDILKNKGSFHETYHLLSFENAKACYVAKSISKNYNINFYAEDFYKLEVIGNIYKNPELLKQKDGN